MSKAVFKNRLRQYIKDHRMTDTEAAAAIGVSRDTLHRLTSTDFTRLDAKTAHGAMKCFGVPFERLFYVEVVENGQD